MYFRCSCHSLNSFLVSPNLLNDFLKILYTLMFTLCAIKFHRLWQVHVHVSRLHTEKFCCLKIPWTWSYPRILDNYCSLISSTVLPFIECYIVGSYSLYFCYLVVHFVLLLNNISEQYSIVQMYSSLAIHLLKDFFQFLVIMNRLLLT